MATPIMTLLKKGPKYLAGNQAADKAFARLQMAFNTAPTLKHPDPPKPFIIEVNTSKFRVGAVLAQHFGDKPKLYTVVFFSKNL